MTSESLVAQSLFGTTQQALHKAYKLLTGPRLLWNLQEKLLANNRDKIKYIIQRPVRYFYRLHNTTDEIQACSPCTSWFRMLWTVLVEVPSEKGDLE